jgi:hypothetical protein
MPKKWITLFLISGFFFFVTVGDRFLPKPLNLYSHNTRQSLNQMMLGLFPDKNPERPSKQREQAIDEFQRKARPKSPKE